MVMSPIKAHPRTHSDAELGHGTSRTKETDGGSMGDDCMLRVAVLTRWGSGREINQPRSL